MSCGGLLANEKEEIFASNDNWKKPAPRKLSLLGDPPATPPCELGQRLHALHGNKYVLKRKGDMNKY